ncbi:MAG TPA: NfeD family protein [Verrucomicrobiota bacterium]|nr:NfeD family protein [Verrucomicrobiota bacterium]
MEIVVALLVVGTALVLIETILPGMIAGLIGFGCLVAGVVLAYVDFGPRTGNWVLLVVVATLITLGVLWVQFFPNSRLGQMFVSRHTIGGLGVEQPHLLDQQGTALTNLRPSGTALINGRRVDVVTEGGMIERGTAVRVIAVEGLRVVVRAA